MSTYPPHKFAMSCHAVIFNNDHKILQLKANYGDFGWGLPGGCIELGETVVDCVKRECFEELGLKIELLQLTGVYFHAAYESQVLIFKCDLMKGEICLSDEHSDFGYFSLDELSPVQRQRVEDAIAFDGQIESRAF